MQYVCGENALVQGVLQFSYRYLIFFLFFKNTPTATTIKPKPKIQPTPKPTNATAGPPGPACYTHQTWSDYENGARGVGLGASMMFVCFVELLMSIMSMASCWAATKVQPTEVSIMQQAFG